MEQHNHIPQHNFKKMIMKANKFCKHHTKQHQEVLKGRVKLNIEKMKLGATKFSI